MSMPRDPGDRQNTNNPLRPDYEAFKDLWETKGPWACALLALSQRRGIAHTALLGVIASLTVLGVSFIRDGSGLTLAGLIGALAVAAFVLGLGLVSFFWGQKHAAPAKGHSDEPAPPGDDGTRPPAA